MKHLMVKHVPHHILRNALTVESSVDDDLLERRIETSKLRSPRARAPAQARARKGTPEILAVQAVEKRLEIVEVSRGPVFGAACAALAHKQKPPARRLRVGELSVQLEQVFRRPPAIEPSEQNSRRCLDDRPGRVSQHVGNADNCRVFAQADRVRQVGIRMVLDHEMRWASFAAEPRIDPLEQPLATRHGT